MHEQLLISYSPTNKGSKEKALSAYTAGILQQRTRAANTFESVLPNISVSDEYGREDYERFRSGERKPKNDKERIAWADNAYYEHGIIYHVINLMADFAAKGIEVSHRQEGADKLGKAWANHVRMQERTHMGLNLLYRQSNVIINKQTTKLRVDQEDLYKKTFGEEINLEKPAKREIPYQYTFLNPLYVEAKNAKTATFTGRTDYYLTVPDDLQEDLVKIGLGRKQEIKLDPAKTITMFYKKDDWKLWATPMIYPISDELMVLEKLRLADLSALDGAISSVRLWRIGSLEHQILPTAAAIQKLANILMNRTPGQVLDLIWGPEIDFKESQLDVHKFLGNEKYVPTLNAIREGLGVPPVLTGQVSSGGLSNNYLSLKTLIDRLEYGRNLIKSMWQHELNNLQMAFGLRYPFTVSFEVMNLTDEAAEKALFIQLADRGFIPVEVVQKRFGLIPEIMDIKTRREQKRRDSGRKADVRGPFITPPEDIIGVPGQGRPKTSKDSSKRTRKSKPQDKSKPTNKSKTQKKAKALNFVRKTIHKLMKEKNIQSEPIVSEKLSFAIMCTLIKTGAALNEDSVITLMQNKLETPPIILAMYQQDYKLKDLKAIHNNFLDLMEQ